MLRVQTEMQNNDGMRQRVPSTKHQAPSDRSSLDWIKRMLEGELSWKKTEGERRGEERRREVETGQVVDGAGAGGLAEGDEEGGSIKTFYLLGT